MAEIDRDVGRQACAVCTASTTQFGGLVIRGSLVRGGWGKFSAPEPPSLFEVSHSY